MCTRARPYGRAGGAALEDGVLQMVSEPTLAVARTSQCAGIGRMAYGSALDVRSCAKRGGSWTFARVSVKTYGYDACGHEMGHTA